MLHCLLFLTVLVSLFSEIDASSLSLSGPPVPLTIIQAIAGQDPLPVSDSSTSYNIVNNNNGAKILGSISSNMPLNTTLTIYITAPSGATRPGPIALSTTPATLTANIPQCSYLLLPITYTFSAKAAAKATPTTQTVLTLTLSPG